VKVIYPASTQGFLPRNTSSYVVKVFYFSIGKDLFECEIADMSRLHPVQDPAWTASDRDAACSRDLEAEKLNESGGAPREISQRKLIGTMCCWELGHDQKAGAHAGATGIFVDF
jgi:hypothetical protein